MEYRILASTGLRVSVVGIGTWQLGGEWGHAYTQTEADAIFDKGAELGINLIDTAECYGDHLSERFIGDYLSRRARSRWIIATKFGHRFNSFLNRTDDFSVNGVRRQLEESLGLRADEGLLRTGRGRTPWRNPVIAVIVVVEVADRPLRADEKARGAVAHPLRSPEATRGRLFAPDRAHASER